MVCVANNELRHCSTFLSRYYYYVRTFLRITIILSMYYYVYLFFFAVILAKRYSTKEACEILINDEFSESDSEDSLDYEIGSDSSSTVSYSEVDSDPENDFSGRKISISKQDATTTTRDRQLTLGKGNITTE